MIAFVGDQLGRCFLARCRIERGQLLCRGLERAWQAGGVALLGGVQFSRNDRTGVEVQRMLGLVGQTRAAILQLGNPGVRIDRTLPVGVRQFLADAARSSRTRSSAVGVAMPLSLAIRVSISR